MAHFKKSLVQRIQNTLVELRAKFALTAFADESSEADGEDSEKKAPTIDFEELISRARREEREKLYPQIEKQKEKTNNALLALASKQQELEAALAKAKADEEAKAKEEGEKAKNKRSKDEDEDDKLATSKLSAQLSAMEAQIEQLKADNVALASAKEAEKQAEKMQAYLFKKLHKENIIDVIPELISGSTEEEIDASIEASRQRFNEIFKNATAQQRHSRLPVANPSNNASSINTKVSETEIAKMSNEEYAAFRKQAGLK